MSADDPRNPSPHGHRPSDAERARADETRRVWAALGAYADEPVPDDFAARVLARVRSEPGAAPPVAAPGAPGAGRAPFRVLPGGRFRGLAIAASLVASLGAGVLLSQRFLVREPISVPTPTAALEAVPADLLDNEGLVTLASLPEADFEALLLADAEAPDAK